MSTHPSSKKRKRDGTSTNLPLPSSVEKDSAARETVDSLEEKYVHAVYECIADHFSHTRFRLWPKVTEFMQQLPTGALVFDVGCGNGKYLGLNKDVYNYGCDMSESLIEICRSKGQEVMISDSLRLPVRSNSQHAVLSIAVIHHFITVERRMAALTEMYRVLAHRGEMIVYVWSFEKGGRRKGVTPTTQDVYLPWHLPERYKNEKARRDIELGTPCSDFPDNTQYLRYYYLFREGELEGMAKALPECGECGCKAIIKSRGFEFQNWYAVITKIHAPTCSLNTVAAASDDDIGNENENGNGNGNDNSNTDGNDNGNGSDNGNSNGDGDGKESKDNSDDNNKNEDDKNNNNCDDDNKGKAGISSATLESRLAALRLAAETGDLTSCIHLIKALTGQQQQQHSSSPSSSSSSSSSFSSPAAPGHSLPPFIGDACCEKGFNALILASKEGHLEIVSMLLEEGSDVNYTTGHTAVRAACIYGHSRVLERLIEAGAKVDLPSAGNRNALMGCVMHGHIDCVRVLLQHDCDVGVINSFGETAIDLARIKAHADILELLLRAQGMTAAQRV